MFSIASFLTYQILWIIRSQMETERIFYFTKHASKPKEMLFTIKQFREIDFCE
jgi:hypothetical protein